MPAPSLDRRTLLKLGGGLWAATLTQVQFANLARAASAQQELAQFATLTPAQAMTLEAIAGRILPTTDTPGAREAGAVWFMDAALGGDFAQAMPLVVAGIEELESQGVKPFSKLSEDEQDAMLRAREDSDFFEFVRFLTIAGTLTLNAYGGNRDNAGWTMLGFDAQHHWQPPFGFYDRDMHGASEA